MHAASVPPAAPGDDLRAQPHLHPVPPSHEPDGRDERRACVRSGLHLPQALLQGPPARCVHGGAGVLLLHDGGPAPQVLGGAGVPAAHRHPPRPRQPRRAHLHPGRLTVGLEHSQGVCDQRGRSVPHGGLVLLEDVRGDGAVCGGDAPAALGDAPGEQAAPVVQSSLPGLHVHGARVAGGRGELGGAALLHLGRGGQLSAIGVLAVEVRGHGAPLQPPDARL
mmetsp:Transcript_41455/g.77679  ORF Transcript_41455/g.77679 Transcript_41455/m.77679 type:complete len:222 (+) Transcript_41455:616-1281(+)